VDIFFGIFSLYCFGQMNSAEDIGFVNRVAAYK
jgi:hypothetical protein